MSDWRMEATTDELYEIVENYLDGKLDELSDEWHESMSAEVDWKKSQVEHVLRMVKADRKLARERSA